MRSGKRFTVKGLTLAVSAIAAGAVLLIPAASPAVHLQPGACAHPTIVADNQGDTIHGTNGPDVIRGGNGPDTIFGHRGDDRICGGSGPDQIFGQRGDDRMNGNHGADVLRGNRGTDRANGAGSGNDTCKAETEVNCEN
jgi:Ca2+-binding RTX toxin-like protein